MVVTVVLPETIRSKKNSKRPVQVGKKGKKRLMLIPSKAYLKWEKLARIEAWRQLPRGWTPVTGPVHIIATIYYKGRRPDLSGAMESVGDCMEKILYANDSQIESWDGTRLFHDLENPRTYVTMKTL